MEIDIDKLYKYWNELMFRDRGYNIRWKFSNIYCVVYKRKLYEDEEIFENKYKLERINECKIFQMIIEKLIVKII